MRAIDITTRVDHEGQLPMQVRRMFKKQLLLRSGEEVRITMGKPKASTKAKGYYWGVVLPTIRMGYLDAGVITNEDELHETFKIKYLPYRTKTIEGTDYILPASTRELDSQAFYEYIEHIRSDDHVLAMGILVPDPDPNYRSYNLERR